MATIYRVTCESFGEKTELEISDSPFGPFDPDTWRALDASAWEVDGGEATWDVSDVVLLCGGRPIAILQGFGKTTGAGETGEGDKIPAEGSFPPGPFTWHCTKKN